MLVFILVITVSPSFSQCAMCKATIENNAREGGNYAAGLNKGILYLMSIPYIAAGVIVFFWYKNSRNNSTKKAKVSTILGNKLGNA
jgi:hypothetical protein